jgi:glycosyltransferase involved in cell wall biosynthesis
MRVVIGTTQVPFVRGGAEMLADSLKAALIEAGHEAEIVSLPFKWYPAERILDHMLANRLMKVEEACGSRTDRFIGLKFPAYLMPHSQKVLWLLHQYRAAYDAWDGPISDIIHAPNGRAVRDAIQIADAAAFRECRAVYTLSHVVSDRLLRFNGVESVALHHPPPSADDFRTGDGGDYILMPSRIDQSKRQHLLIEALALTRQPVRAVFIGASNASGYEEAIKASSLTPGLQDRIEWLGGVTHERKVSLYAGCLAVAFLPVEEDYGYVTLEAMLSGKAVLTCTDSGGPLEFIRHDENGLVSEPSPRALADALDRLWMDRALAARLGTAARESYRQRNLQWSSVVDRLLG